MVRYNSLIDIFLGLTAFSLHSKVVASIQSELIEIEELYIGLDQRDCRYAIPVQTAGQDERISGSRAAEHIEFVEKKFRGMRTIAVGAKLIDERTVALFELRLEDDKIKVVKEKHYALMPPNPLRREKISDHHQESIDAFNRRSMTGRA